MSDQAYLTSPETLAALKAMPLESRIRGVPIERVVSRLKTERSLFLGALSQKGDAKPWLMAIVVAERAGDAALAETLASLALQSCPGVRCAIIPRAGVDAVALSRFIAGVALKPATTEVWEALDGETRPKLRKAHYVTFLRHGDQLHPSAAAWTAEQAARGAPADLVSWGELQPAPGGKGNLAWAQRNPGLQRETLLHLPYMRNAFAVASRFASAYGGDLARELVDNQLHLFQIWLAHQGKPVWRAHPEYFLIRAVSRAAETPETAARSAYRDYALAYRARLAELASDLALEENSRDAPLPYRLAPVQRPGVVSVIILFRDKPELTLRAAAAVARQTIASYLEIVLVNNQSTPASLDAVRKGMARLGGAISSWRLIDFDEPFNHSRQCNIGVEASLGEALVFLNNDCEILSPTAIDEMTAWAMRPGVGSVGLAIRDPDRAGADAREAAGMEARLGPVSYFDSIVEERSSPALTPAVRHCFGNTFACAAVSRAVFQQAGGLDAVRFPNGYNDVDFACRTRALGLRHLALGHLKASHAPGQSRARTDESPQKILIRTLYPEAAASALVDLAFDDALVKLSAPKA